MPSYPTDKKLEEEKLLNLFKRPIRVFLDNEVIASFANNFLPVSHSKIIPLGKH